MGNDPILLATVWSPPPSAIADESERLRLLVDAVTEYAIFLLAPDGTVMTWNPGAERLKGYSGPEIVGRHFSVFYPPDAVAAGKPQRELDGAVRAGTLVDDGWRVRKDGTRFWAHVVLTALFDGATLRGFAKVTRDDTGARAAAGRGRALQEITSALLLGTETAEVLAIITRHAGDLTGAGRVWLAMPEGRTFVVRSAAGPVPGPEIGTEMNIDSVAAAVMVDREPIAVDDVAAIFPDVALVRPFGAGLLVPLLTGDGVTGVLVAAAAAGASPFRTADLELLEVFAYQAELVLSYGRAQQALRGQQVLADRERIARDLHDHVIQQLFATGLALQSTAIRTPGSDARKRIEEAVDHLDDTIRQIRTTIFELHERDPRAPHSLRADITGLIRDAERALGFQATLQLDGAIDFAVPPPVAVHLVAALREMMSNVARHAHASAVTVTLTVTDELLLRICDDGQGLPEDLTLGSGLRNLRTRAQTLGGSFTLLNAPGQGTVASWRVPVLNKA